MFIYALKKKDDLLITEVLKQQCINEENVEEIVKNEFEVLETGGCETRTCSNYAIGAKLYFLRVNIENEVIELYYCDRCKTMEYWLDY